MNIHLVDFYYLSQKIAFQIVHKTTIWVLLVFFLTAASTYHLSTILDKHNARQREAILARKTACVYVLVGIVLWTFSILLS